MREVPISDPLYVEVQRAAIAQGVSIERFVREAVQLRLADDLEQPQPFVLSEEQEAAVMEAQAEVKAGRYLTLDQLDAIHQANRARWISENES